MTMEERYIRWRCARALPAGEHYKERVEHELKVIISQQFVSYFLVLADVTDFAHRSKIRLGPGRGSAGGSLVAYCLGITDLDPISLDLSFERFLNADRVSPPDIDIDVDDSKRDILLNYVREKYGADRCANIGTIGTIGAKKALRDSARVLGRSFDVGTRLTWSLPRSEFGRMPLLSEADMSKVDDTEVFDLAVRLEGLARASGVHAAGFVVSPVPLADLIPLYEPERGKIYPTTQWDGKTIEALGFTKYDFLGLKNLGIIDDTLLLLSSEVSDESGGQRPQPELPVSFNDPRTYDLLQRGETTAVFQLDSPGMQRLLRQIVPTSLADVAATLALYRPGPMGSGTHKQFADRKHGRQGITYPHKEFSEALSPILGSTYGLIVYQEQVMRVLQAVAGYTANQADLVRRAMGKKDRILLNSEFKRFHDGCKSNGYSDQATQVLWDTLVPFADYSFNKSHAVGYAYVSYWTAWLKANYPKEYMCAVLSRETDPDTLPEYINEAKRMGLSILPPSVNAGASWSNDEGGIRYGLTSIKGCGEKAIAAILRGSPYKDWSDYLRRVPKTGLNVGVVKALGLSGALDCLGPREAIMAVYEVHCDRSSTERTELARGERGFGTRDLYALPEKEVDYAARARGELAVLGTELSAAPLVVEAPARLVEGGWEYIRRTSEAGLGNALLVVRCGPWELDTGYHVDPERVRSSLAAIGCVLVE